MEIALPQLSLVLLAGPSGSGKTTFGATHFGPHEVVSSDACRALVSGDETALDATDDAFDLLYHLVGIRLRRGLLTVVDATNVRAEDRRGLVALAREHHVLPTVIVLLPPLQVCLARTAARADRSFGEGVVRKQYDALRRGLRGLKREGFRQTHILDSEDKIAAVTGVARERLYNDLRHVTGPLDIVGDVHGCLAELGSLLGRLGYAPDEGGVWRHPAGRQLCLVGDLVDRGPDSVGVLRLVMRAVAAGAAYCVIGNHDAKLQRYLAGKKVQLTHGLLETSIAMAAESDAFRQEARDFLYGLISHYVFDGGRLVVAHAGLPEAMHGRGSRAVREFAMYGETTGEIDAFGLPVRYPWARDYRGAARVVYGHTPVPAAEWLNDTIDIDTGCCFGGSLTALRYPELETVSVPALRTYVEPARPVVTEAAEDIVAPNADDDLLDVAEFLGKRRIETAWAGRVTVSAEKAAGALETMSRFAVDPRWLVYLPPTMSPCAASELPDFLEHPLQAFSYYRRQGVTEVVCEEKHMGSRAVVVLCRRPEVATARFGVEEAGWGAVYTRTGRAFFPDGATEQALLKRLAQAAGVAGLWTELATDWLVLDCEVMPWSAKAQSLIESQYAAVGACAKTSLTAAAEALQTPRARALPGADRLLASVDAKRIAIERYCAAYRPYCWPVTSLDDYAVAPFHVLASEGAVHLERDHGWHLGLIDRLCAADPGVLRRTERHYVDPRDEDSVAAGTAWWLGLTEAGGEGMVVKPLGFAVRHNGKLVQPGVKCRGRDYLRLIYGPTYTLELDRLRDRHLQTKRSLAVREFALGAEALRRFVDGEPLRRVHECVFGVLALEGEGVDARL